MQPPVRRPFMVIACRVVEIAALCAAHASRWAIRRLCLRREDRGEPLAWIARLLERLGPTFIKIGQVLSARPDLTPAPLCAALARLQEHVEPVPWRMLQPALERSFGAALTLLFASIDPRPVAAGSIAQVHRGILRDGRVVAVKIRRPGVERIVAADLALLRAVARMAGHLPGMHATPVRELVEEVARPVAEQLDFRLEAQNHRAIRRMFRHAERLTIPALIDELCTDAVLTMEFVHGLQSIVTAPLSDRERRDAALVGLRALYRMIFEGGLVHADMHPGNVFARAWGEVVMLDMGLVARLTRRDREAFVDFFFGMITDRGEECARIVVEGASALGRRYRADRFTDAMRQLVARHARRRSREFEISAFVTELIALQRRFDVRGSTAFMSTVLAMVVYEGICKQLYPECDFQSEARGFLVLARYAGRRTTPREPSQAAARAHGPGRSVGTAQTMPARSPDGYSSV
jgi:ubiquinone biosynthesis protein